MSAPASDNELSLGSVPDIETFIEAEKTREDATKQRDKEVVGTKTTNNQDPKSDRIEVDELETNPQEMADEQLDKNHDQNDVPELEDSIMEEYEVNDDQEELQQEQVEAKKAMDVDPKTAEPVQSAGTPQIDTSYDFSDQQEVLNLPKKRVPSYLQPTISYSQKVRAKYDPRSVSGSSQRSFSGSRTYSAEYHLREARLFEQRQNEMDVEGRLSRDGANSPDSSGALEMSKRGGSRKQVRREFSREFTPSFPFNKENVN
ncbi:YALI0B22220p [Yarrowia lipolytica CLIB122]|jgi:recombination DNA repair RAD52 pathway protein|uniref:YALI0B22220p n=2 Tax=Yarrowia lipolytica TaxID=4952 RepID=Q6CDQ0_YARLI|nr:YALI0B22220p [Yarrowia lipolytica CLIB122]AOW02063.1 hypothetical protein YALI1_B29037g [Yarrowia lipolytica]KAB8283453.1 hypothetical protein BKA91DRAFT_157855 [Yarrowia lipolytica]KAE8173314.1 hypothetical protein BKA90DRAFT_135880 [Yarrowia lipolytica]KAJ8052828.1 hypothetical protein LXG23DRAFT_50773 [Yarrowia lipolytica]QNP96980.1 Hypothetical protein YALI2_C00633g [Yarrowia lipolytica]|eukprot:XP_501212.1 YALI0B22220p [Yarrowia lipolytica CLIB122]